MAQNRCHVQTAQKYFRSIPKKQGCNEQSILNSLLALGKEIFLVFFMRKNRFSVVGRIRYNILALSAVADFGAQNCQYTTKVDAR